MRCGFALTKDEIIDILDIPNISFVLAGNYSDCTPVVYERISIIPNIGISSTGDKITDDRFIVVNADDKIVAREISQSGSSKLWAFDNLSVDGAIICLGGEYGDRHLIGEISVQEHMSDFSKAIFKEITKRIKNVTRAVKGIRVSKSLEVSGVELTLSAKVSPEYDFSFE